MCPCALCLSQCRFRAAYLRERSLEPGVRTYIYLYIAYFVSIRPTAFHCSWDRFALSYTHRRSKRLSYTPRHDMVGRISFFSSTVLNHQRATRQSTTFEKSDFFYFQS